eukprot:3389988-Pyramimonas_sp.AAC.1
MRKKRTGKAGNSVISNAWKSQACDKLGNADAKPVRRMAELASSQRCRTSPRASALATFSIMPPRPTH